MANKHLTTNQLAERWHLTPLTLIRWRKAGKGPKWLKVGRRILYPVANVEEYENNES